MNNWQASGTTRTLQHAEAQLRRADSYWQSWRASRDRITRLRLCEISRRCHMTLELDRRSGPDAIIIRKLERAADWAHDRRLFERDKMVEMACRARDAELQAEVLYQESEGR